MASMISGGNVVIGIQGDTAGLETGLARAEQSTAASAQRMGRSMQQAGMAITAAGAAITGALTVTVMSYARAGDEVQKMALRTGFATETLSEFRHAAELSGTSLGGLETGIRRMQRAITDAGEEASDGAERQVEATEKAAAAVEEAQDRVIEAYEKGGSGVAAALTRYDAALEAQVALTQQGAEATGEYTDSLAMLGLSFEQLEGKSPEQQFITITGALANVDDATRQAAIAQEIFGRSGTALLPMLSGGSEGLARMRQEAHELGIVFDQEAADKAALFNDNMLRLRESFQSVAFEVADTLLPALETLIPDLIELIQWTAQLIRDHPDLASKLILTAGGLGLVMDVIGPLLIAGGSLVIMFSALAPALGTVAGWLGIGGGAAAAGGGVAAAGTVAGGATAAGIGIGALTIAALAAAAPFVALTAVVVAFGVPIAAAAKVTIEWAMALADLDVKTIELSQTQERYAEQLQELGYEIDEVAAKEMEAAELTEYVAGVKIDADTAYLNAFMQNLMERDATEQELYSYRMTRMNQWISDEEAARIAVEGVDRNFAQRLATANEEDTAKLLGFAETLWDARKAGSQETADAVIENDEAMVQSSEDLWASGESLLGQFEDTPGIVNNSMTAAADAHEAQARRVIAANDAVIASQRAAWDANYRESPSLVDRARQGLADLESVFANAATRMGSVIAPQTGSALPAPLAVGGGGGNTIHASVTFGNVSVRSDRDITEIEAAVSRSLVRSLSGAGHGMPLAVGVT